jgi:hypothetical protein
VATEVVTLLRDDIDGSTAERTVSFSWDGAGYEIDLSKKNIAELNSILAPYVDAARGVSRGRRPGRVARSGRGSGASVSRSGVDLGAVRAWAAQNGHAVAARGRISSVILDAFHAASGSGTTASTPTGATRAARPTRAAKAPAKATRRAVKRTAPARKRAPKV